MEKRELLNIGEKDLSVIWLQLTVKVKMTQELVKRQLQWMLKCVLQKSMSTKTELGRQGQNSAYCSLDTTLGKMRKKKLKKKKECILFQKMRLY
jgi:hypothetical protein